MAMSRSMGASSLTTWPSIEMSPELITSRPAIMRKVVVLQQPEGFSSAAARRADKDHELPVTDLQIDVVDGVHAVVELVDALEYDLPHWLPSASTTMRSCPTRVAARRCCRPSTLHRAGQTRH